MALVLDDLNLLDEPTVLDGLDYVLRNAGAGLRLLVSSRTDPLLPLHRYRLAGELAEIRASDLAFSIDEAGLVMAQHGITLSADSLECLTRRTEGWAACIRLAALSMGTHPDPDRFVKELAAEDSAVTGYLVEEVLNAQLPEARELLLSTSILEQVSAEAASELAGHEQAAGYWRTWPAPMRLFSPSGTGGTATTRCSRRCCGLSCGASIRPRRLLCTGGLPFGTSGTACWPTRCGMPPKPATGRSPPAWSSTGWPSARSCSRTAGRPWPASSAACRAAKPGPGPQPYLVLAAAALFAGRPASSAAALDAAEGILGRLPADQEAAARLAAAMIGLAAARRTGDFPAAAAAADVPRRWSKRCPVTSWPGIRKSGHGYWPDAGRSSCGRDISTRRRASSIRQWPRQPLRAGSTNKRTAWGIWRWPRRCAAGWAAQRDWPPGRRPPSRPASGCRPPAVRTPRRSSRSLGCTWSTMSCARPAAASGSPAPPSPRAQTS